MATVSDFRAWYERDLSRFASWDKSVDIVEDSLANAPTVTGGLSPESARSLKVHVFTDKNSYSISVREPRLAWQPLNPTVLRATWEPGDQGVLRQDDGYLGCIADSRKPRAGEDWTRGSDLSDGPLSEVMWRQILADIVSYELVDVHISHKFDRGVPRPPPIGIAPLHAEGAGSQEVPPSDEFLSRLPYETASAIRRLAARVRGGEAWNDARSVLEKLDRAGVAVDAYPPPQPDVPITKGLNLGDHY